MRCLCCNRSLSDYESTIKHSETSDYLDMCMPCIQEVGLDFVDREDLRGSVSEYDDLLDVIDDEPLEDDYDE